MKLPRWLVILMLSTSVLAVLVAAGWWWFTWPERTAREFVRALADGRYDDATRLMPDPFYTFPQIAYDRSAWEQSRLQSERRSLADFFFGRQRFKLEYRNKWSPAVEYSTMSTPVVAERGVLSVGYPGMW